MISFDSLVINPLTNILVVVYYFLNLINFPYALGFSIVLLTVIVRIILYPLMASQLKASKKMQEVNPHLQKIKEKHKGDPKMLQQETMRLYKEFGINPAAGCLPVIIQIPIIWGLYTVLQKIITLEPDVVNKVIYFDYFKLTKAWDPLFFGLPLSQSPAQLISKLGPIVILVPILTGLFQYIQSKMLMPQVKKEENANVKKKEDFAASFQKQTMYFFPLMIGFFSYSFSIGLSLYWNTFTIFGIIQQYKISGLGGLKTWTDKLYGKKRQ